MVVAEFGVNRQSDETILGLVGADAGFEVGKRVGGRKKLAEHALEQVDHEIAKMQFSEDLIDKE